MNQSVNSETWGSSTRSRCCPWDSGQWDVSEVPILWKLKSPPPVPRFAIGFESLNRVDLQPTGKMPPPVSSIVSNGVETEDRAKGSGKPRPLDVPDLLLVFQTGISTAICSGMRRNSITVKYGVSTIDPRGCLRVHPRGLRRFPGQNWCFDRRCTGCTTRLETHSTWWRSVPSQRYPPRWLTISSCLQSTTSVEVLYENWMWKTRYLVLPS